MSDRATFNPAWASPPGDTILAVLRKRNLSLAEFAGRMEASLHNVECWTRGLTPIDKSTAEKLERVLGSTAAFWINRERNYRSDTARLKPGGRSMSERDWLNHLPVRDMIAFGWIRASKSFDSRLKACFQFFGVNDTESWESVYGSTAELAAFRASTAFETSPGAVAAWLRWSTLKADEVPCAPWDRERFKSALGRIRSLTTRKEPERFLPELSRLCAECGVAVVLAPAPTGCRASGATKFLSSEKAMLALSFRYRTDDHFWFTFFHEAGHLVLHRMDAVFLEDGSEVTSAEEAEADDFAARTLVPPGMLPAMLRLGSNPRDIIRFATHAGISPGIIVGQLQHAKKLPYDRLNSLKRRYVWIPKIKEVASP